MKNVLITGGAGFVGSNLARMLVSKYNCKVTVIDDFFSGNRNNLIGVDIDIIEGSVEDEKLLNNNIKSKDTIFHLAARNIIVSSKNPLEDMQTNIRGTYNVLNAAFKYGVEKIIYTSTASVYGNSKYLPINEEDTPQFLNFYSVSKYAGEGYAKVFYEQKNLPVCIIRYSNVFGYFQNPSNPYSGVIGKFIHNALKGQDIIIHGNGDQTRDFTFVDDACTATIMAGINNKTDGEVFNVGSGIETSINSLAMLIIELTGSKSKIIYTDKRDIDNIRRRVMNIEKLRHKIKFSPQFTIQEGLKRTIEWMKKS